MRTELFLPQAMVSLTSLTPSPVRWVSLAQAACPECSSPAGIITNCPQMRRGAAASLAGRRGHSSGVSQQGHSGRQGSWAEPLQEETLVLSWGECGRPRLSPESPSRLALSGRVVSLTGGGREGQPSSGEEKDSV